MMLKIWPFVSHYLQMYSLCLFISLFGDTISKSKHHHVSMCMYTDVYDSTQQTMFHGCTSASECYSFQLLMMKVAETCVYFKKNLITLLLSLEAAPPFCVMIRIPCLPLALIIVVILVPQVP